MSDPEAFEQEKMRAAWDTFLHDPRYPVEMPVEKKDLIEVWISLKLSKEWYEKLVLALIEARHQVADATLDDVVLAALQDYLERHPKHAQI